ncbi:MAG: beta-ketoacyl-[acyl-carrier-protein] synthase family protein, partial [Bacteroidales bacterium]|nr:beta-ketoacyl-[acyl-carrier-protein] synthase family protein [Candidatus Colimorpha onthohippi]
QNIRNEYIKLHDCGACTEMIANQVGEFSFVTTLSTACSSAANAIICGAQLIADGRCEIAVVGGCECVTKFHLNGFNALRILDDKPCRPFDCTRAGLNLGEGAAYLVLESADHATKRGAIPQAILAGYGNTCDAFHQTATSPNGEGPYQAMTKALCMGMVDSNKVDYVNAHGTGTPVNDISESEAMRRVFGSHLPHVSSTKSFTGHTTSASGAIESVLSIIAMQEHFIPANLNFSGAADCIFPVSAIMKNVDLRYVLCNSFGFGGNDSSLLLAHANQACLDIQDSNNIHPVYVYAAQQISIQEPLCRNWMNKPIRYGNLNNKAIDPDYSSYIQSLDARRMCRLFKRALAVSKLALSQSEIAHLDAVVTGTGLGCMENTESFLDSMCRNGEQFLKPTSFMQSTHNAIGSLIAIHLKCHGYNATYAHRTISFDSALMDAFIQIHSGGISSALVGGFDEFTPTCFKLIDKSGYFGRKDLIFGESATSLVLGNNTTTQSKPLCRLLDIQIIRKPTIAQSKAVVISILKRNGLSFSDISGVFIGLNQTEDNNQCYQQECVEIFGQLPMLKYKHIFGESFTASGLGIYAAACCIDENEIPKSMFVNEHHVVKDVNALFVFNNDDNNNYSFTLLSR